MTDLAMSVLVTRTALGLGDLDLNDHDRYVCAPQFLGAMVSFKRQSVGSPFMDDEVTVYRSRGKVTEQIAVEVDGAGAALKTNVDELISAMIQDRFTLVATTPAGVFAYACEAADYQGQLSGPRLIFGRLQCLFSLPRSPVALSGVL